MTIRTWAVAAAFANSAVIEWMRFVLPFVNRLSGALLIVVGLYVGYYGVYEVRLFHADGNPADPLVNAAGRVQGALAGWVQSGQLKTKVDVQHGLENAPETLRRLFEGRNEGKQLLRIAE